MTYVAKLKISLTTEPNKTGFPPRCRSLVIVIILNHIQINSQFRKFGAEILISLDNYIRRTIDRTTWFSLLVTMGAFIITFLA